MVNLYISCKTNQSTMLPAQSISGGSRSELLFPTTNQELRKKQYVKLQLVPWKILNITVYKISEVHNICILSWLT
jgi:hypothetical protein